MSGTTRTTVRNLFTTCGVVVDPFGGSGTTGVAALSIGRRSVLIDNNADYVQEAITRLTGAGAVIYTNGHLNS